MSFFRTLVRTGLKSAVVFNVANAAMITHSLCGTDNVQQERLQSAPSYSLHPKSDWESTLKRLVGMGPRILPAEEMECVDAFTRLLCFTLDSKTTKFCAPNVVLNDSLICFDGLSEMKDGWWFLSQFFSECHASPTRVRRDVDTEGSVVLHIDYETDAIVRFTNFGYTFPSHATLVLENASQYSDRKRISVIEHRWFKGPIVSRMTSSHENTIGDAGDILRRMNGFVISLVLTLHEDQ